MELTPEAIQGLAGRLARLESELRLWRAGGLLVILAGALFVALAVRAQQVSSNPPLRVRTVKAEHFLLKDSGGITRGQLAVVDGQPALERFDAKGQIVWSTKVRIVTNGS